MTDPKTGGSTTGKPSVLNDKEDFGETAPAEKLKQMGERSESASAKPGMPPRKPETPQDG